MVNSITQRALEPPGIGEIYLLGSYQKIRSFYLLKKKEVIIVLIEQKLNNNSKFRYSK
jgi:hypothetical protein